MRRLSVSLASRMARSREKAVDTLLPEAWRARHVGHRTSYAAAPRTRPMGIGTRLLARRADGSIFPMEVSLSAMHLSDDSS